MLFTLALGLVGCTPTPADVADGPSAPRGGLVVPHDTADDGTADDGTTSGTASDDGTDVDQPVQTWRGDLVLVMFTPDGMTEIDRCEGPLTASVQPTNDHNLDGAHFWGSGPCTFVGDLAASLGTIEVAFDGTEDHGCGGVDVGSVTMTIDAADYVVAFNGDPVNGEWQRPCFPGPCEQEDPADVLDNMFYRGTFIAQPE